MIGRAAVAVLLLAAGSARAQLLDFSADELRAVLRNVALTAPYMHNGSLATLADVVRHYSELDLDRLHADGESLLKPLRLTGGEAADLVAFLESLTERESALPARRPAHACQP